MAATLTPESAWAPNRFPNLETVVGRTLWPTPDARDANPEGFEAGMRRREKYSTWGLQTAVQAREWPTPTANRRDGLQSHGVNAISGQLNPAWVELLMGYPPGWTDLDD